MNIEMTLAMFLPSTFRLAFTRTEKEQKPKKMLWEDGGGEMTMLVGGGTPLYKLYITVYVCGPRGYDFFSLVGQKRGIDFDHFGLK